MRWNSPKIGDQRVIKIFLWIPTEISKEVRWLERARIRQIYIYAYLDHWEDLCWENN